MTKYTNQTLAKGEKVLKNIGPSKWQLYTSIGWLVIGLATIVFYVGWFFLLVGALGMIYYYSTEFALTNKKVLTKTGLFARNTDELQLKKIEGCDVRQSMMERLFGYGSVVLSGTGTQKVVFAGIDNPLAVKKLIDSKI